MGFTEQPKQKSTAVGKNNAFAEEEFASCRDVFAKSLYCCLVLVSFSWYRKTSSTFFPNMRAILKAKSSPGSYFPVSTALMHCRVTPTASARSACDHSFSALKTRSRVFILDTARKRRLGRCSTRRSSTPEPGVRLRKGNRIVAGCRLRA